MMRYDTFSNDQLHSLQTATPDEKDNWLIITREKSLSTALKHSHLNPRASALPYHHDDILLFLIPRIAMYHRGLMVTRWLLVWEKMAEFDPARWIRFFFSCDGLIDCHNDTIRELRTVWVLIEWVVRYLRTGWVLIEWVFTELRTG